MPPRKNAAKTAAAEPKEAPATPARSPLTRPAGMTTHEPIEYIHKATGRTLTIAGLDADLKPPVYVDAFFYAPDRGEMRLVYRRAGA